MRLLLRIALQLSSSVRHADGKAAACSALTLVAKVLQDELFTE